MKEKSPVGRIWEMGEKEHGKLITAVILAVLGVACGMAPYFAAAKIIVLLLAGEKVFLAYLPWLLTAFGGFLLRTVLYNGALGISHRATFSILKTIREKLLAKLPRLPLGTVMDTSSGKLKEIIVDQVDSMETTLAHLFPEMTANAAAYGYLSVCSGLAFGAAFPCGVSDCGHFKHGAGRSDAEDRRYNA